MASTSVTCPICGANIPDNLSAQDYICCFCKYERRTAVGIRQKNTASSHEDVSLPFQEDLNEYFAEKFQQMAHGALWHLSIPVNRPFLQTAALPGQINFFRAKNIMFLLEQHGFKMAWRQNRFSSTLRIIARKS